MATVKHSPIRTIFIGTPDFGLPSLRGLFDSDEYDVVAVISQPDKKAGRRQTLAATPVKQLALELGLRVLQPAKIASIVRDIKELGPDLIVVIAYAQIISPDILALPKYGCLNLHGSLLPKYRGAACVQAAIINGDASTGLTLMLMDKGLDTGPIIAKKVVPIAADDTAGSLSAKLSNLGGNWLPGAIQGYINGEIKPVPQDKTKASYVGLLKKDDGHLDWQKPAIEIERFIRAMTPWPGAHSKLGIKDSESRMIKIIQANPNPLPINKHRSGTLFSELNKLFVQCGQDSLEIKRLQLSGKKPISAEDFIRGYPHLIGNKLT